MESALHFEHRNQLFFLDNHCRRIYIRVYELHSCNSLSFEVEHLLVESLMMALKLTIILAILCFSEEGAANWGKY